MALKTRIQTSTALKTKLNTTLQSWLPILQSGISDLENTLNEFAKENPFLGIKSNIATDFSAQRKAPKDRFFGEKGASGGYEAIERYAIAEQGLEESLFAQIEPPLFPTERSQEIAKAIIENLDEDGYFDGEISQIAENLNATEAEVERIRRRFAHLEPSGIAALNVIESFRFQLDSMDVESELYSLCSQILDDLENHSRHKKDPLYPRAMNIIRSFRNPPAIDFSQKEPGIIPDLIIEFSDGKFQISVNDRFYPTIEVDAPEQVRSRRALRLEEEIKNDPKAALARAFELESLKNTDDYIRAKAREARELVDALEMRKATLYKVGLMLLEYQYEFFNGGEIKPMRLKDLADEFGHATSTISRAISNKYLECSRGVFALKNFFTAAIDEDTSNAAIKDFLLELVKNENRQKPLSDIAMQEAVEKKFNIKIVRRTITKYRLQANIGSSAERKRIYKMAVE